MTKIGACRICGNTRLEPVVDLGEQYLTGVFPDAVTPELTKGPLRLVKCDGNDVCNLLQLDHSYDLGEMYGDNYGYRSGLNPSMVRHLRERVRLIRERVALAAGDLVVDIGSNDGTTLAAYPDDLVLIGVDPTGEKFRSYYPAHVQLVPDFFPSPAFSALVTGQKAKVVTSFSMFYDLEDPVAFAAEVAGVLDEDEGIWVLEQSYMPLMLERNSYDTICHEHLEYYGLSQIRWIADQVGLKIVAVETNDINGGSFVVTVAHMHARHEPEPAVERMLAAEATAGMETLQPYREFAERVEVSRNSLNRFLAAAKAEGKTVYGLGASTKGNVILQFCGIDSSVLNAIGDVNPDKDGALTPGSWISITAEDAVLAADPDYLLVLPWHFRGFFTGSPLFKGRNLVFPLPTLEVVTPN